MMVMKSALVLLSSSVEPLLSKAEASLTCTFGNSIPLFIKTAYDKQGKH